MKERVRRYLPFIGIPNVVLVLGIVAACLAAILLAGGRVAALPATIAETWFVLHGVPVIFDGVILGSIPLLPAILVAAFIAWRVRMATRERVSVLDLYAIFGLVVLIPFTLSAIAWFMVADASSVFPVTPPAIHKALFIPVSVHLAGMACGMSERLWRALFDRASLPVPLISAMRAVSNLALRLLAVAGIVYLGLLAAGYGRINDLVSQFPVLDRGGAVALVGVCILYLPNAVIATLSVLLGAPFQIAGGGVSLFSAALVPLPPLPLFGAIPGAVPAWAPVLMIVPAAVLIRFAASRRFLPTDIAIYALIAAVLGFVGALMAGGDAGAYGWIGPSPLLFALAALCWVAVVIGLAWLVAAVRGRTAATEEAIDLDDRDEADELGRVAKASVEEPDTGQSDPGELEDDAFEGEDPTGGSTAYSVLKQHDNKDSKDPEGTERTERTENAESGDVAGDEKHRDESLGETGRAATD
nr:Uncharacterised protein [Streptococcus thermophilus]